MKSRLMPNTWGANIQQLRKFEERGKNTDPGDRVPGDVEVTRCRDPRRLLSRLQAKLLHLDSRLGSAGFDSPD